MPIPQPAREAPGAGERGAAAAPAPRPLGASGVSVGPLGFGAWAVGGGWGDRDPAQARRALERALELGITFFDTAPTYGGGASEALLGSVLAPVRERVIIATKCGPRDDPRASLEASLRRLRTDRVDLLQLHEVPEAPGALERQLEGMQVLVQSGKARWLGLSNAGSADVQRALAVAALVSLQGLYNLLDRDAERELFPLARAAALGFLAYRPLASGLFTGKYAEAPRFGVADHRANLHWFRGAEFVRRQAVLAGLEPIARACGLTLAQLALAWALARPEVTVVLVGARSAAQVEENARAAAVRLTPEDVASVAAVVERVYAPCALRRDVRVAEEPDAAGELEVSLNSRPLFRIGAREAFVLRRLDGRTPYADIAQAWRDAGGGPLLVAQIVHLVDQLAHLELLEPDEPA